MNTDQQQTDQLPAETRQCKHGTAFRYECPECEQEDLAETQSAGEWASKQSWTMIYGLKHPLWQDFIAIARRCDEAERKLATELALSEFSEVGAKAWKEPHEVVYVHAKDADTIADLRAQLAAAQAEVERLNKMRTHCDNCGADYLATGVEAGCPCLTMRLKDEVERLRAQVAELEEQQ